MPDGSVGVALGQIGITATDFSLDKGTGTSLKYSEADRDTRGSEGGFNDQLLSSNANFLMALNSQEQQPTGNELGLNGNAPLAANRHAIDSQPDTGLTEGESAGFLSSVVNESRTTEATVNEHGSVIGDRAIGVADFDVSSDLSTPGSERAIAELNIFNAKKLSLMLLQPLPGLIGQQNGLVGIPPTLR
jgi:hypothetical protein